MSAVYWILAVAAYLLPAVIAAARKHPQSNAIFVLNLLLGWTFLGWVGALVWAFMNAQQGSLPPGDAQPK